MNIENARVAELADAHGSGPCESNFMGVQVPPLAPVYGKKSIAVKVIDFFFIYSRMFILTNIDFER